MSLNNRMQLDIAMADLSDNILKLASLADEAITKSMEALEKVDSILANQVISSDEEVNALRYQIEQDCYRILATQSPAASDLRQIIASVHLATNLERIGDHAAGIAQLVNRIGPEEAHDQLYQLPKMAKRVQKMMRQAIQAYITRDAELAYAVIQRDDKVDRQYGKFTTTILDNFEDISSGVTTPTYMLWIGHALERIGDRVTNIAERVIFVETGEFVEINYF